MRLLGLLLGVLVLTSSVGVAQRTFSGTTRMDAAVIEDLVVETVRGLYNYWDIATSGGIVTFTTDSTLVLSGTGLETAGSFTCDDNLTVDSCLYVNGDSVVVTSVFADWMSLLGAGNFWGVCTFDTLATFNGHIAGDYADIDSVYSDVLGTAFFGGDSVVINHDLFVGGLTGLCQFYDDVVMDSTLQVLDLEVTGAADLGGASDTIAWFDAIAGDTLQAIVLDGVITSITNY